MNSQQKFEQDREDNFYYSSSTDLENHLNAILKRLDIVYDNLNNDSIVRNILKDRNAGIKLLTIFSDFVSGLENMNEEYKKTTFIDDLKKWIEKFKN